MTLTQWYGERWLAQRLGILADYDQGITTTEQRRERIRAAVLERGPGSICAHSKGLGAITFEEAYRRTFNVALTAEAA